VIARIVASGAGQIAEWPVQHGKVDGRVERVEVQAGDTVDFVVEFNGDLSFDSFGWAPIIRLVEPGGPAGEKSQWNAQAEFGGNPDQRPDPLDAWGQLAQALLMSNEFMFVD